MVSVFPDRFRRLPNPISSVEKLGHDAIRAVVIGRTGETVVNGKTFWASMIPLGIFLTDDQIAKTS